MAGFTDLAETDWLDLFFTNVDFPNVGDAAGLQNSAAAGVFTLALHAGDAITDASTVLTDNEVAYTGYARPSVNRDTGAWTVTGNLVTNDALIQFGEMTAGGPDTVTDVSVGFLTGTVMQIWGQVTLDLVINNGVNPQLAINALDITVD
jgi:hypothetical protein